jgi:MoaA/NifB/PqqE/SkfB family radical SAM enzyme
MLTPIRIMIDQLLTIQDKVARRILRPDVERPDGRSRFAPIWLILCINNFCNLKCRMCDVGIGEQASVFYANMIGEHPSSMSLELLRKVLESAAEFRPRPKIGLAFTEPLNHARIVDFCNEIVSRGFYGSMTTNGFLLPQRAEALVKSGLDEITISVDGPSQLHDTIRGRKGSFARLYEGIVKVNEAKARLGKKTPFVRISATVNDLNYRHLHSLIAALAPLRPDHINVGHLSFITPEMAEAHNAIYSGDFRVGRSSIGEMDLSIIDPAHLADEIGRARQFAAHLDPPLQLTFHPELNTAEELERYYHRPEEYVGGRRCTDPFKMMMVNTDGSVIPAHSRCYNYPVGNVQEMSLTQIWNNARYVAFRQVLYQAGGTLPACTRCCGVIGKPAQRAAFSA